MLTIESLNATNELVAILADKGVVLDVVAGSPLAEAMSATKTAGYRIDMLTDIEKMPLDLFQLNDLHVVDGIPEDHPHSAYLEASTAALGTKLAAHIAHATTVVLPLIGELHNRIKETLDLEQCAGIRAYKVEMVEGSPLLNVAEIVSSIDKFGKLTVVRELPLNLDFPAISDEQLIALLKIGSEAYDTAVDQFVSASGIEVIREVYDVVFTGNRANFANYDHFRADRKLAIPRNFVTFLLASKYLIDPSSFPEPDGRSGLSSSRYSAAVLNLQEVSGAALHALVESQRSQDKTGKLIDKIDGKTVFVNKTVYDRFMAEGGDVETILGAAINGGKLTYLNDIVAEVADLKQAWQYHVTISKQNAATSTLIDTRRTIDLFVRQTVRTSEDEVVKQNAERIIDRMIDWLPTVYAPALKSVDVLAMRAVCEVIFEHTDALQILSGVSDAMSINPDITKEDALNLSVLSYVAGWYASQVVIA